MINLRYVGPRDFEFRVVGGISDWLYFVPGPGELVEVAGRGEPGVLAADVPWFLSINRGRDYTVVEDVPGPEPEPEEEPEPETAEEQEPEADGAEEVGA